MYTLVFISSECIRTSYSSQDPLPPLGVSPFLACFGLRSREEAGTIMKTPPTGDGVCQEGVLFPSFFETFETKKETFELNHGKSRLTKK